MYDSEWSCLQLKSDAKNQHKSTTAVTGAIAETQTTKRNHTEEVIALNLLTSGSWSDLYSSRQAAVE